MAQSLPWMHPLEAAQAVNEPYWVLLYSATSSSRYSFLAHQLDEKIESSKWDELDASLLEKRAGFTKRWFGYLGYDLKDSLETLPLQAPHRFHLPHLLMMRFRHVYVFDHHKQTLIRHTSQPSEPVLKPEAIRPYVQPSIHDLRSNMSKADYLAKVESIIRDIEDGKLYQANLTRKFMGSWDVRPDGFSLFTRLCQISPASYSAYLQIGDFQILSSSPELFLRIDANKYMESEPIKGSARRYKDQTEDEKSREVLLGSEKDRAENLMIVDLMRHDFARSCVAGSVSVKKLFELTSHPTIHHLSSLICGKLAAYSTTIDAIKACFPPGSMTGAPKIKAMELCTKLECDARGIYSGALGWLDGDGSAELSVVIRTLIARGCEFEFQVGGGIVADSTPKKEWEETLVKARAISQALEIAEDKLMVL